MQGTIEVHMPEELRELFETLRVTPIEAPPPDVLLAILGAKKGEEQDKLFSDAVMRCAKKTFARVALQIAAQHAQSSHGAN